MRCKIAAAFGQLPSQIARLPMTEYRMLRNYVLAVDEEMQEANKPKDGMETETWGNPDVANAPWQVESVTGLE
jgi:hypothetical protein